jgi:uncharacterized membrane protein
MEESFRLIAHYAALLLESLVILLVLGGAAETLYRLAHYMLRTERVPGTRRGVWMSFARWLLLALEFALGADIIRTAIAPSWTDIGQLAAIAAVRTGLGFFLEKDIGSIAAETPRR